MRVEFDLSDIPTLDGLPALDPGGHPPDAGRACAMEVASWLAGERWSDHPRAVHPVIAQAARVTNDTSTDAERQLLWPLVLASLGTGARWKPTLWWRLERHGLMMQRAFPGNPRRVWEELLKEHTRMTGFRPQTIPTMRLGALKTHLTSRDLDALMSPSRFPEAARACAVLQQHDPEPVDVLTRG